MEQRADNCPHSKCEIQLEWTTGELLTIVESVHVVAITGADSS